MKNTEKYFHGVAGFIEDMQEISGTYDRAVQRLEPFKGSVAYEQGMQTTQAERDASVQRMRENYLRELRDTLGAMRDAVKNRPLVPPMPEQAALLNVLQMRKSVSRGELDRATKQLEGCPTALAVLADLAERHKVLGFRYEQEWSIEDALNKIDTLEGSARKLLQEGVDAASHRIPKDITACLSKYGYFNPVPREGADTSGGVRSEDLVPDKKTIAAFCKAVDG